MPFPLGHLIALLVVHHIADVWAQPSWLIENKKKHPFAIYEHVMIYAGIMTAACYFTLGSEYGTLLIFFYFLFGHYAIDFTKYITMPLMNKGKHKYEWIYGDQAAHYLQIILIVITVWTT